MFCFIVSTLLLSHYMIHNYASIFLWLVQSYSRIQMYLQQPKQIVHGLKDRIECLVDDRIVAYTADKELNKINNSTIGVLISNKNMILFYPPIDTYSPEYEVSDVRFISVNIEIIGSDLNICQDIKLKTPDYSFYVVGNELNVDFVRYYFLRFENIFLPCDVQYTMTIVDENVRFHSVDQNECIAFEKDSYQFFTYKDGNDADDELNDSMGDDNIQWQDEVILDLDQMIQIETDMMKETIRDDVYEEMDKMANEVENEDALINKCIAEYDMSEFN